jgi:hypothetical protein
MSNYNYIDDIDEGVDEKAPTSLHLEKAPLSNYDRLFLLKGKAESQGSIVHSQKESRKLQQPLINA